jgi:toxin ParE1/3/4
VKHAEIRFSDDAVSDILEQSDWYRKRVDVTLAERWEQEVDSAVHGISRNPQVGALCKFRSDELAGTRRTRIKKFPKHLIFYQTKGRDVLILRVLHGARDLESLF